MIVSIKITSLMNKKMRRRKEQMGLLHNSLEVLLEKQTVKELIMEARSCEASLEAITIK